MRVISPEIAAGLFRRAMSASMAMWVIVFVFLMILPFTVWGDVGDKIEVFVSIAPQADFVQRIGGDRLEVSVLVPPGKSPATYAPSSEQMLKLSRASILFIVGVPFESALIPKIKAMAPGLDIVDTRRGLSLRTFADSEELNHEDTDDNESAQEHSHGKENIDPHIWMSPKLVKQQAGTMCEALCSLAPADASLFRKNLEAFERDLDLLDQKIRQVLLPLRGQTLFVFHPVFGYFADAYGLKQLAVERGGKTPKGKDLVSFIQMARENQVRVIFVQPQFDQRVAAKIASAIGGAVVPLDPLARDYMENLSRMAQTIQISLGAH
ncbi:metal ABC transporter solute-binding protein, Zn/Mn family [Desulfocicer niacini]